MLARSTCNKHHLSYVIPSHRNNLCTVLQGPGISGAVGTADIDGQHNIKRFLKKKQSDFIAESFNINELRTRTGNEKVPGIQFQFRFMKEIYANANEQTISKYFTDKIFFYPGYALNPTTTEPTDELLFANIINDSTHPGLEPFHRLRRLPLNLFQCNADDVWNHKRKPGPKPQDIMKSKKSNYYTRHEIEAFGRMVSGSGDKFVQKDNKSYLREVQIMAQQVVDIVESELVLQTVSMEQRDTEETFM
eukprot:10111_1